MKKLKFLLAFLAFAGVMTSCGDDPETIVEKPVGDPVVTMKPQTLRQDYMIFELAPGEYADSYGYALYQGAAPTAPTAQEIVEGTAAGAMDFEVYSAESASTPRIIAVYNCKPGTEYMVYSAALNTKGQYSDVVTLSMTTVAEEAPTVTLAAGAIEAKSFGFTVSASQTAKSYTYVVVAADATAPTAMEIFEGVEGAISTDTYETATAASSAVTVEALTPETAYAVYAASMTELGTYSDVAKLEMTTVVLPAPEAAVVLSGVKAAEFTFMVGASDISEKYAYAVLSGDVATAPTVEALMAGTVEGALMSEVINYADAEMTEVVATATASGTYSVFVAATSAEGGESEVVKMVATTLAQDPVITMSVSEIQAQTARLDFSITPDMPYLLLPLSSQTVAAYGSAEAVVDFAFTLFGYADLDTGSGVYTLSDLDPGTEHTIVVCAAIEGPDGTAIKAGDVATVVFTTADAPPPSGGYNDWIGTWSITSASSVVAGTPLTQEIVIQENVNGESYSIYGWDTSSIRWVDGISMPAAYDSVTGGFTVLGDNLVVVDVPADGDELFYRAICSVDGMEGNFFVSGGYTALTATIGADKSSASVAIGGGVLSNDMPFTVMSMETVVVRGTDLLGYGLDPDLGYQDGEVLKGPFTMTKTSTSVVLPTTMAPATKSSMTPEQAQLTNAQAKASKIGAGLRSGDMIKYYSPALEAVIR